MRFDVYAALGGCKVVTADGRRAYVTGYHPEKKWGVLVKSGADKWVCDSHGFPLGGDRKDQVFTEGLMKGGAE